MSNFTDFFAAAAGGGGGIPKYQEFTSSGTFTPTQALIDAGGRVAYMIVGGGERGSNDSSKNYGGAGGQFKLGYTTLTSTTGCAVTIGAGGTSAGADGGSSSIAFNSAGGAAVTASGGSGLAHTNYAGYGGESRTAGWQLATSPHPGHFGGYGAGGGNAEYPGYGGGIRQGQANMGQGSVPTRNASAGFVRITWFE